MLFKHKNNNIHLQIYEFASTVIMNQITLYFVLAFSQNNIFGKENH